MTYIIKDITPEEREQILEETRSVRKKAGTFSLNENHSFLFDKKKNSDNYYDRIINEANGNYFINLYTELQDTAFCRYLFYYQGKTYLMAIITASDLSEGGLRCFGNDIPTEQKDIDNMLTELAEIFRINGAEGRGWDDEKPWTQFVPKILIKKEGSWL